ncbi:MAG TPA: excinuclease ABC subunit A [Microscillaceae bacterium]|nr:excinuclease ABC subunit A [Microscillaceae bacterium]
MLNLTKQQDEVVSSFSQLDPRDFIIIKGARANNLKDVSVALPRNKMIVVTGLSGSGKSSLVFDTLFAEGQRMYVESLSAYARQFLGRMEKPEVDYIKGICPAIAVEQKGNTKNPRATIGTTTEIYDYLKLLFARVGLTFSPISGEQVRKDTVSDVVNYIQQYDDGYKFNILAPLVLQEGRQLQDELKVLFQKGFTRVVQKSQLYFIEEILQQTPNPLDQTTAAFILIDRSMVDKSEEDNQYRIADSVQTAFYEGHGTCWVEMIGGEAKQFSDRFELDGLVFEEPNVQFFSFNSPYGACKTCGGFGNVLALDENLVVPDHSLSVHEGVVAPWNSEKMQEWKKEFIRVATLKYDFPVHRSYRDLDTQHKELLWKGAKGLNGIRDFFAHVEAQLHKIQYRVLLSRYRGKINCPDCKGTRLRKDAAYVKIADKSIMDLVLMSVSELLAFFENITLNPTQQQIAKRLLIEIRNRLAYLDKVGLGYLTLNRLTASLSGGEYQRIKLATALGSALVGSMYILDEPSIGLHPRDTERLVAVLKDLRDLGNTVVIVEHEEEVMRAADQLIDIGYGAGVAGGELIFQGALASIDPKECPPSHTLAFLYGLDEVPVPPKRRAWKDYVEVKGARAFNLKQVDVKIPLEVLVVITGVSGSGKSTLIHEVMYPALAQKMGVGGEPKNNFDQFNISTDQLAQLEFIDQNPIGKSSRSNPATYTKVYDQIRQLFADIPLAKQRGYQASHFSFNVDNGRCETCQGEGTVKVEMQFMADIYLKCESCQGNRFKKEILEVQYQGKNIAEVLALTVDESLDFFQNKPKIAQALKPLADVGLGYIGLGQSTATLSGGEAQRLKLASFLDKKEANKNKKLFIFDEPTTGLHFYDVKKLLQTFQALIDQGNSVWVIEHNLDVIKSADWIIDLGPEGGGAGGNICFAGTPENLAKETQNHTARFLKPKLGKPLR